MNEESEKMGLAVTLVATSSVLSGILLCLAVWILSRILVCDFNATTYFYAYVAGSVGFLLAAPVNLFLPILMKHSENTPKIVFTWCVATIGLFLLACIVGVIFMFFFKWIFGMSDSMNLVNNFIFGALILFISGSISWIFNRNKRNNPS